MAPKTALQTDKAAFKELTPYLMYCIIIMSSGMMIYGLWVSLSPGKASVSLDMAVTELTSTVMPHHSPISKSYRASWRSLDNRMGLVDTPYPHNNEPS
jgi:hypothetical protein